MLISQDILVSVNRSNDIMTTINHFTDKSVALCISEELDKIADQDCKPKDSKDIIQSLIYLLVTFDVVNVKKNQLLFEAVNEIPVKSLQLPKNELSTELLHVAHKKFFPKSATNHHEYIDEGHITRMVVHLEQVYLF